MYDYSVLAILAAIALFSKPAEMRTLVVFSGMCTLMLTIGQSIERDYIQYYHYHFSLCALLHLVVMIKISKEKEISNFIFHIYIINLAFIYLNLFGFILYDKYIDSIYFNTGCEVLYSLAIAALFYKWHCDGIWRTGIHLVINFYRSNMRRSLPQLCFSQKEERA